jgi:hypothetical protein
MEEKSMMSYLKELKILLPYTLNPTKREAIIRTINAIEKEWNLCGGS